MTDQRWKALMADDALELHADEVAEGWHFCNEYDGLLVGPGMSELHCCQCLESGHPVYATKPLDRPVIIDPSIL